MNLGDILWSQKAHSNSNTFEHFGYFLYEFVSARFTIIAFIGLFNFAGYNFNFLGHTIATGIALFLYYIISDAFNIFWTGLNLKYSVTEKGILFEWGVLKEHELFIPFEEISRVLVVKNKEAKRFSLIFENDDKIKNGDFGFSKEIYFDQLSFENISDIDSAVKIISGLNPLKVFQIQESKNIQWTEKVPNSNLYLKFLQLLGLVYIYLATMITMTSLDNNLFASTFVKDIAVKEQQIIKGSKFWYRIIETQQGHVIKLKSNFSYKGEEVEFFVSPLFKHVTKFESFKFERHETLVNGYKGLALVFKLMAIFITFFSGSYIFYKRGFVPFVDLSVFLLFPAGILLVAFCVFH